MTSSEDYGSSDSDEEGLIVDDTTTDPTNPKKRKKATTSATTKPKSSNNKPPKSKKAKTTKPKSFIDDAASLSGSDDDDSEEEEDDDDNNDYERDGFVVDEADDDDEEPEKKKKRGDDLEDSDDDDNNDDDDDDNNAAKEKRKKLKKLRDVDVLDEDDLDLINEARGGPPKKEVETNSRIEGGYVKAKDATDLQRGLFTGDDSEEDEEVERPKKKNVKKMMKAAEYDEDGLDDFIEDDIGDQDEIVTRTTYGGEGMEGGVSEAQLNEASDIFGTDYLDFMGEAAREDDEDYDFEGERRKKFRERGVGVALGVDSDEEIEDDSESEEEDESDDDLFGDEMDNVGDKQRAEVLRLKREKKRMAREERRRERRSKIEAKRKAKLRRAFEPVQLVENFCTERDDDIRQVDTPERFYDWLDGKNANKERAPPLAIGEELTLDEREQAQWIIGKIPAIQSEFYAISANNLQTPGEDVPIIDDDEIAKKENAIVESIANALRYMRGGKLEPDFIQRYRKDYVTSPAVRENLYRILDEDAEWERMTEARLKIDGVLSQMHADIKSRGEDSNSKGGDDAVSNLREELKAAQEQLDETVKDEERVKVELEGLEKSADKEMKDKDDDDDELFGDDDDDDEAVSFHCVSIVSGDLFLLKPLCAFAISIRPKKLKKSKRTHYRNISIPSHYCLNHKQRRWHVLMLLITKPRQQPQQRLLLRHQPPPHRWKIQLSLPPAKRKCASTNCGIMEIILNMS